MGVWRQIQCPSSACSHSTFKTNKKTPCVIKATSQANLRYFLPTGEELEGPRKVSKVMLNWAFMDDWKLVTGIREKRFQAQGTAYANI